MNLRIGRKSFRFQQKFYRTFYVSMVDQKLEVIVTVKIWVLPIALTIHKSRGKRLLVIVRWVSHYLFGLFIEDLSVSFLTRGEKVFISFDYYKIIYLSDLRRSSFFVNIRTFFVEPKKTKTKK